ncbi:unnamed protein product, partial [Discosporangium mesarthrocarpum]
MCNGKKHTFSHPFTHQKQSGEIAKHLFMDLSGKKAVSSLGGSWYNAIIRDDFSRFMRVYPLKAKSDAY